MVVVPVALSVGVHTVLALVVRYYAWFDTTPPRITDVPVTETLLTFEPVLDPGPALEVIPDPAPAPVPEPIAVPVAEVIPEEASQSAPPVPVAAVPETEPAKPADLALSPAARPVAPATSLLPPPPALAPPPASAPSKPPPQGPSKATFAGVKADRAERVVYVVDASGAMTTSLTFVLDELSRSIGRLDESQQFQVILFREPPPSGGGATIGTSGFEIFHPPGARVAGLLRANDSNKDAVRGWLRTVRPLGRSAPLPGLRAALELRPQLVFLLTRSITRSGSTPQWGSGNAAVLKTLDELNPHDRVTGRRAVTLKAIQFLDDDPSGLLRSIAEQHGDGPDSYTLKAIGDLK